MRTENSDIQLFKLLYQQAFLEKLLEHMRSSNLVKIAIYNKLSSHTSNVTDVEKIRCTTELLQNLSDSGTLTTPTDAKNPLFTGFDTNKQLSCVEPITPAAQQASISVLPDNYRTKFIIDAVLASCILACEHTKALVFPDYETKDWSETENIPKTITYISKNEHRTILNNTPLQLDENFNFVKESTDKISNLYDNNKKNIEKNINKIKKQIFFAAYSMTSNTLCFALLNAGGLFIEEEIIEIFNKENDVFYKNIHGALEKISNTQNQEGNPELLVNLKMACDTISNAVDIHQKSRPFYHRLVSLFKTPACIKLKQRIKTCSESLEEISSRSQDDDMSVAHLTKNV